MAAQSATSYVGLWNNFWHGRSPHETNDTMSKTAAFFNEDKSIAQLEDWGCGVAIFRQYLKPHIEYIGIDGSHTGHQTRIEDLCTYRTQVDAIYMKHVMEHNWRWKEMLEHLLESFTKKAVIVIFTPWSGTDKERVLAMNQMNPQVAIPDLALSREAVTKVLDQYQASHPSFAYSMVQIKPTKSSMYGEEQVIYLTK